MVHTSIIIGAGFSGICMAIKLKEQGIRDFVILEKASGVGGTWRENTYPGAECDIPSALYSYSFESYPDWEYKWSHQPQILDYIKMVVDKYELNDHFIFDQEFLAADWDQNQFLWKIRTQNSTYQTQTFIPAIGQLHHPSIPDFAGKEKFKGVSFHSAKWDHDISLDGKKIGVIGNAASAIQFIPEIAKSAGKITIFQRSPNWMLPKQDKLYKDWEKSLVRKFPLILKLYRLKLWLLGGALYLLLQKRFSYLRKIYQGISIRYIKKHIKDVDTQDKLIPKFPFGAKRVLFSDNYYQALARENVELHTKGIKEITQQGIRDKIGKSHSFDLIIYSTGFKANPFFLNLKITGKNGVTLKDSWQNGPKTYLGITTPHFPNMFMMYGPNTNLGHSSILIMSEAQAKYITNCVKMLTEEKVNSLEIKTDIVNDFHKQIHAKTQKDHLDRYRKKLVQINKR